MFLNARETATALAPLKYDGRIRAKILAFPATKFRPFCPGVANDRKPKNDFRANSSNSQTISGIRKDKDFEQIFAFVSVSEARNLNSRVGCRTTISDTLLKIHIILRNLESQMGKIRCPKSHFTDESTRNNASASANKLRTMNDFGSGGGIHTKNIRY